MHNIPNFATCRLQSQEFKILGERLFSFFEDHVTFELFVVFFQLESLSGRALVLSRRVEFIAFCAFHLDIFACTFCHKISPINSYILECGHCKKIDH